MGSEKRGGDTGSFLSSQSEAPQLEKVGVKVGAFFKGMGPVEKGKGRRE